MKALQQVPGAWDRIATREELSQVFDLLESIPTVADLGRFQTTALPMCLVGSDGSVASRDLWLDRSESEEACAGDQVDANLESLAELFADRSNLVN